MKEQDIQAKRIKQLEAEGYYVIKLVVTNKKLKYIGGENEDRRKPTGGNSRGNIRAFTWIYDINGET